MSPSDQMHMQVKYLLAGVPVAIDHNAVSIPGNTVLGGGFLDLDQYPADESRIFRGNVVQSLNMFFRDEKKMNGGRGLDVPESEHFFVLVNDRRLYLRSEEHTSELQSHSFISYAVFCL